MSQSTNDKINATFSRMQRDLKKNTGEVLDEEQKRELRDSIEECLEINKENIKCFISYLEVCPSYESAKRDAIHYISENKANYAGTHVFSDSSFEMCEIIQKHLSEFFHCWLVKNM